MKSQSQVKAQRRRIASHEGEALATWARFGAWVLALVAVAVVWSLAVDAFNDVPRPRGRRRTGPVVGIILGVTALVLAWIPVVEYTGPRRRRLVLLGEDLWVRAVFQGWRRVAWDRIEWVGPIQREPLRLGTRGRLVFHGRPAFRVVGLDEVGMPLMVRMSSRTVREPLEQVHERLLAELGRRFGEVESDEWDAARDAPDTPAAASRREFLEECRRMEARRDPVHDEAAGHGDHRPG